RCCFMISFSRGVISICSQGCSGAEVDGAATEGEEAGGVPCLGGALSLFAWAVVTSKTPNTTESRTNLMLATPHVRALLSSHPFQAASMVHNLIPIHILPVASQRSRACREVMEERRGIIFPVAACPIWDAGPCTVPRDCVGGERLRWPSPSQREGRLGANPTWSDCAPTPPGRTTLE